MAKNKDQAKLDNLRHSLAHILAAAVLKFYPETKLGIGPTIENGFYYDFQFPQGVKITEEVLTKLEKEMKSLIKAGLPFRGKKVTPTEAKKLFKNQPFKLDLISEFTSSKKGLSVYRTGDVFLDLCRGGHVKNTDTINPDAFKLTKVAGAYWRGDERNPMLTRIYGAAFETKKELNQYLKNITEAKKRDHRQLGKKLELFVFSDLVGSGLPLFTPRGKVILDEIKNFSRALRREIGYQEVQTPQINRAELFKISGHYEKYKEDMFRALSNYTDEEYFLKPMNCPQHTQMFASQLRSYKDLPIKYADFSLLYRDEKPGELSGLTRLRSFSQDDGHCFCREDQIEQEFSLVLKMIQKAMKVYGMNYYVRISLRDEQNKSAYLGQDSIWRKSQNMLKKLVKEHKLEFVIAKGEAAFYGPKMDLIAKDALNREWQISTIQLDFNMPQRFGLHYIGEKGKKRTPLMIHSALVGSPERFLGVLLEHYGGRLPLWLSPVQAAILPIAKNHSAYAQKVNSALVSAGVRSEIMPAEESLGRRIRKAELQKIPYILVAGDKEKKNQEINVRSRDKKRTETVKLGSFAELIVKKIKKRL